MTTSPASETTAASDFVCDSGWLRAACAGEPFYIQRDGKRYCIFHFPGKEKSADFREALHRRINDNNFDFRGFWFPDQAWFFTFKFGKMVDFSHAIFNEDADFTEAVFSGLANFYKADLGGL